MPTRTTAHAIFFLSGVAGLGYQFVWTRMFAVGLGHELPSMLAVVAAFFVGLALGASWLDGRIARSAVPGRWYAALEFVIAGWALLTILLIPWLNRLAATAIGIDPDPVRQWAVSFALPCLGLLPATCAMGATFPAMERLVARLRGSGRSVAGVYAINTAGAVAGILLTTFLVVPAFGLRAALLFLAALNVICAVATLAGPAARERARPAVTFAFADPPPPRALAATLFTTGLLGIGYEVLGVRVMSQVTENTVYTFALALSVFLSGTALGAALYQRFARAVTFQGPLTWLLQTLTVSCLAGVLAMRHAIAIQDATRNALGGGAFASIAAEVALAVAVFLMPTIIMGMLFSHLVQAARRTCGGVGRAVALNTLGAALAPAVFGVWLLPLIGSRWALSVVALGYVPLLALGDLAPRRLAPLGLAALLVVTLPADLVIIDLPEGMHVNTHREGVMAAVSVLENDQGHRLLKVNNRFRMGATFRSFANRRQAHIPLLLHPAPRRVLFLGLGTGMTAGAASVHPDLAITGVDLVPEVVELLPAFAPANRYDDVLARGAFSVADARRYVRAAPEPFDVIVADLFHPARDGAGSLYTREHFAAVRSSLANDGLFCQWLPLYQLDASTVRLIVRTFLAVFPESFGYLAAFNVETPMLGLIGRGPPGTTMTTTITSPAALTARIAAAPRLRAELEGLALDRPLTLFGSLLAGPDDLRRLAGDGPLNTDDHPRVIFEAPHYTYRRIFDGAPALIETLLDVCAPSAALVVSGETQADNARRAQLDRYLTARNHFLRGLIRTAHGRPREGLAAMFDAVRASRDFRTASAFILQAAIERSRTEPDSARRLFRDLRDANPADDRAARYLETLFDE